MDDGVVTGKVGTFRPAPAGEGHRNATVGALASQYGDYVAFYRAGAECLVRDAMAGRGAIDDLVYPIVYMYRHALELALKDAILWVESSIGARCDAGEVIEAVPDHGEINTHDLTWLARRLKTRAAHLRDVSELDPSVERLAADSDEFDAAGERLRYPSLSRGRGASWPEQSSGAILVDILAVRSDFTFALNWLGEFSSAMLDDTVGWMELAGTLREWESTEEAVRAQAGKSVQRARDEWDAWAAREVEEGRAAMELDAWYLMDETLAEMSVETLIDDERRP